MWARIVEMMLGWWLLLSPFVFRHGFDAAFPWVVDFGAGALVIVASLLCFHPRLRRAHLAHLGTAAGLLVCGWVAGLDGVAPAHQNWVVTALVLLMFAIVPSRAHEPPAAWRRFHEARGDG